jgi:hypothetical protein
VSQHYFQEEREVYCMKFEYRTCFLMFLTIVYVLFIYIFYLLASSLARHICGSRQQLLDFHSSGIASLTEFKINDFITTPENVRSSQEEEEGRHLRPLPLLVAAGLLRSLPACMLAWPVMVPIQPPAVEVLV